MREMTTESGKVNSKEIIDVEEMYQVASYKKFPLALEWGKDVWVYTSDGVRYLDLYGGHAVMATGHCHPRIVQALTEQAGKLCFYSNLVYSDTRARAAGKLVEKTDLRPPPPWERISRGPLVKHDKTVKPERCAGATRTS